jgi:hypothetical protein
MDYRCFAIDKIPDLTLSKYSFLDEGGVDGVLKKTGVFLRQMNRKGQLSKVFCHLLYAYDPDASAGHRMKAFFIVSGKDGESLSYTQELVQKSALSAFYNFRNLEVKPDELLLPKCQVYPHAAALVKRVFSVESSIIQPDNQDMKFHRLAEWKMNENARLYNLFQLMQGLNQPAAFRVDLFPVDYAAGLRDVLPIQELRARTSMRSSSGAPGLAFQRDENAEETLRQYEKIIKDYESAPHFRANILAFAHEPGLAALLADAAGAEALESGSYRIELVKPRVDTQHRVFEGMDKPVNIAGIDALDRVAFLPSLFLLDEVRPFFTFPALHDGETIEIPKETSPLAIPVSGSEKNENKRFVNIDLGDDENGHAVFIGAELFKKHIFIAGVPGSGKTNTMLHLATTLWKMHKVPFLILEPAKKEYRALANIEGMEDMLIFSPSSGSMFPLHINPFEFPAGMRLSEHIRNLMTVFEGAFQLVGPAPFLVDSAIEAVYREKGWHPHTENPNRDGVIQLHYPTLSEFYQKISVEVDAAGYEGETKSNVKSFVQVRLGSLLRREMGDLFDVSRSTLPPEEWLSKPVLIELEAMGNGPANFLTLLLCTLIREALKVAPREDEKYRKKPRHVIFLEEAHNLIGPVAEETTGENANPKLAATAYIVKMLAEVRALHEGIVIADQLPTKMAPEVIKNTGLKIGHRLTAEDDRNLLGGTMSASATQLEQLATYEVGDALVATEKLLRPYKTKIRKWQKDDEKYESPSDEKLFRILVDSEKLDPPKNPAYDNQLKQSMEICYDKFLTEQNSLLDEKKLLIHNYEEIDKQGKESISALMTSRTAEEKMSGQRIVAQGKRLAALDERLDGLLSSLANLYYKEKGYFEQNPVYKVKIYELLMNLQKDWIHLYEHTKTWHKESADKHKGDNDEIIKIGEI